MAKPFGKVSMTENKQLETAEAEQSGSRERVLRRLPRQLNHVLETSYERAIRRM